MGKHLAVIGCGYVGTTLAEYWQQQGNCVTGTTTRIERVAVLQSVLSAAKVVQGHDFQAVSAVVSGQDTVVVSIAPLRSQVGDPTRYAATYLPMAQNLGKLIQESDLESHLNNEFDRQRTFLISLTFLSLSVILLLILLLTLTRLKSSHNLPPNSHLIAFIPEECVAEMGALERRMKKANASHWEIRLRLLEEFVTLIWVFYIQIKLENLSLPFQDKQIDE